MKVPSEEIKTLMKERLFYDSQNGIIKYKMNIKGSKKNVDYAGSVRRDKNTSYYRIFILRQSFLAHRIAWFLYYNVWPNGEIDHIDGNGLNNKIINLREVNQRQNAMNRIHHRKGRLGGCHFDKKRNKWQAQISINGKSTHLGSFETEQEAHERYLQARKEIEG